MKIKINNQEFRSIGELKKYIQNILYSYKEKEHLNEQDLLFMKSLLFRHPNYKEKIGAGIEAVYIKQNPIFKKNKGFWLIRKDGSETDFSFIKCLYKENTKTTTYKAFRDCVKDQIQETKDIYFLEKNRICPITKMLFSKDTCEVDHTPPQTFKKIVQEFIKQENINSVLLKSGDCVIGKEIIDPKIKNKFQLFHKEKAHLRVISRKGHKIVHSRTSVPATSDMDPDASK